MLLASWLQLRGEGDPNEPLFLPVRKDGQLQHQDPHGEKKSSLSDQAVYKMVKRRHKEARIKEVSPHDFRNTFFRKTFVGDLLDAIGDLSTVQKLAGHSDPATTGGASGRCGRPPATCTSPTTSATDAPKPRIPHPSDGSPRRTGANLAWAISQSMRDMQETEDFVCPPANFRFSEFSEVGVILSPGPRTGAPTTYRIEAAPRPTAYYECRSSPKLIMIGSGTGPTRRSYFHPRRSSGGPTIDAMTAPATISPAVA